MADAGESAGPVELSAGYSHGWSRPDGSYILTNNSLLQYKTSDGKWHNRTFAELGAGTVTEVATGAGLVGGPVNTTGTISLAGGTSLINIVGSNPNTTLTTPAIERVGRSTGMIRGDQLGGGIGFAHVIATNAPTLVGGGGVAGTTTVSIVPWLISNNASGSTLNSGSNTFITYGANGFRPLDLNTEPTVTPEGNNGTLEQAEGTNP